MGIIVKTSCFDSFSIDSQPRPQRIFSLQEEGENKALEHFKHVVKICRNKGRIFQNNLRNIWTTILKISASLRPEVKTRVKTK